MKTVLEQAKEYIATTETYEQGTDEAQQWADEFCPIISVEESVEVEAWASENIYEVNEQVEFTERPYHEVVERLYAYYVLTEVALAPPPNAFDANKNSMTRAIASGHLERTGHELTGHWETVAGITYLIRTCACEKK
jgi:hypothetical protein